MCNPPIINKNGENEETETNEDNNAEASEDVITESTKNESENIVNDCDNGARDSPIITIKFLNDEIFEKYKSKFFKLLTEMQELKLTEIENEIHLIKVDSSVKKTTKSKKKKSRSKRNTELFVIDTTPNLGRQEFIPKYNTKFKTNCKDKTSVQKLICFNCSRNHNVKSCPLPKDMAKINQNRANFKGGYMKSNRYHSEQQQKYAHFKPGKISDKLRNALGLKENEYPPYVYKMRQLGYPPGWLEEAKIVNSNLNLYDFEGKNVDLERKTEDMFDPDKIIDYPGFNVKPEEGVKDDAKSYGVPYYFDGFGKEAMLSFIKNLQKNGEKSIENSDTNPDENIEQETLQENKQELLAELNGENETKDSPALDSIGDTDIVQETKKKNFVSSTKVKSVFGTPIVKSSSPYSCLPSTESFAKGISPLIHFENLPNSTGQYDKLAAVLDKVRKFNRSKEGN